MQKYISGVHRLGNCQDAGKWHIVFIIVCILELSIGVSRKSTPLALLKN